MGPVGHCGSRRGGLRRPAPRLSMSPGALTVSFGRFWALLGFISRVANLEVPSCQG